MTRFSKLGPCCVLGLPMTAGMPSSMADEESAWEVDSKKCLAMLNGPEFQSAESCLLTAYNEAAAFDAPDNRRPTSVQALAGFYRIQGLNDKASALHRGAL